MGDTPLKGGCLCGKIRIEYTGQPAIKALCHCLDCRKISGSTYSTNIGVPESNFKLVSGTPKTYSKTADSGNTITSRFCGDCGSTLFCTGDSYPDTVIIKLGVMDSLDAFEKAKPEIELYHGHRVNWVPEIQGAKQVEAMP